jgi:Na+/H+ antiporter NhaD/arsenite permease-like protein
MMEYSSVEFFATICFSLAILHTFSVKWFQHLAHRYPEGSVGENIFHLLGEVEVVFGLWAAVLLFFYIFSEGYQNAIQFLNSQNFTEPAFVFVIMVVCATRPILNFASNVIEMVSKLLPFKPQVSFYASCLVVGPISGSLITEPAAMTVTALILLERFYKKGISQKLMYATIGLLFVNVSIGGTLTPFAAPPVLMVASKWNWDLNFMIHHFGWKAVVAIVVSTTLTILKFKKELAQISWKKNEAQPSIKTPFWVIFLHLIFLMLVILSAHHMTVFVGVFLFFLGLVTVTKEYQEQVRLREGLLVAFFLGGIVVLGSLQRWWLEPLLTQLTTLPLYMGSIALTAVTDNAALTFLGAQVPTLTEASRYALVAGAVTGGGLTVIANAPNPAGYGILNSSFGEDGLDPLKLLLSALIPTIIAALCFWFL